MVYKINEPSKKNTSAGVSANASQKVANLRSNKQYKLKFIFEHVLAGMAWNG